MSMNDSTSASFGVAKSDLLSVSECLHTLRIGRTKLYELFATYELRFLHIGRRRFVPRSEVEKFIAKLLGDSREP